MGKADETQVYSSRLDQPHISISELHLLLSPESSPSDPSANAPSSYPTLSEVFGRKRKKRTSIETNIRLTLEKRFQDVSSLLWWEWVGQLVQAGERVPHVQEAEISARP